ncbi:MAG: 8-oxo-dGTP diphosphatase [Acholeplasma sp.]|nr:8-oxo-dGTP diphosphatase [Acholeplasma sp.]
MRESTLCYLFKDHQVLLMHRIYKKDDYNENMWIGVGGKVENESVLDCLKREVLEETGLSLNHYQFYGHVYFYEETYHEHMHLFISEDFNGTLKQSVEGYLAFVDIDQLETLPMWEGDDIFLKRILDKTPFVALHLFYEQKKLKNYYFEDTV